MNLFPLNWLRRLNLKLFVVNNIDSLSPNLWCLCDKNLKPIVVDSDDQQVSFTFKVDNKIMGMSVVYASTCYINRRSILRKSQDVLDDNYIPWSFIGDFNTIMCTHEYCGSFLPAREPHEDFSNWINNNHLLYLPISGAKFTWSKGRRSYAHTLTRLDKVIYNQTWVNSCVYTSYSPLTKTTSDYYLLMSHF